MAFPAKSKLHTALQANFSSDATLMCAILVTIQILDGILTCLGVSTYGGRIEGNPLVRALIEQLGPVAALILVKTFGCLVILALYALSSRTALVMKGLKVVALLYLVVAIGPWLAVLTPRYVLIWLHL